MSIIRKIIEALTPSKYDMLVGQANAERRKFHALKYKNYSAAAVHMRKSDELFLQAKALKRDGLA